MEYYDNDVSVHSVYIQTVFYGLCLKIKYILSYLLSYNHGPHVNRHQQGKAIVRLYDAQDYKTSPDNG